MPRYAAPPRNSGWIEDEHFNEPAAPPALPVADMHVPIDTGLLWATGQPIMRLPRPVGFGRDSEW